MTTERYLYIVVGVLVFTKVSTHLLDGSLDSIGRKPDLKQSWSFPTFHDLDAHLL